MSKMSKNLALDLALAIAQEYAYSDGHNAQRFDFIKQCLDGTLEVQNITKDEYNTLKDILYTLFYNDLH